jgi:two-component system, OmpR family, sensor kinase
MVKVPGMPAVRSVNARMSLQLKLIAGMLALCAAGLLVAGGAGIFALHRYLYGQLDGQLHHSVMEVTRATAVGAPPKGQLDTDGDLDGTPKDSDGDNERPALTLAYYSRVFSADGVARGAADLRTPVGVVHAPPKLPKLDRASIARLNGRPFTASATSGVQRWRVLIVSTPTGASVVALSLDQIVHTLGELAVAEVVVGLFVLVAMVGLAYLMIRSSLRPLMRVEATAEAIAAGDLGLRVPEGHDRTEVGRLARSLNVMLAQIEAAFQDREASAEEAKASAVAARESAAEATESEERMRRFVADAGHELRTPLTSIRGFAELLHRQIDADPAKVAVTTGRIEAAAKRMTALVEDLLLLARLDQQRPLKVLPVDLLELAADAVSEFQVTNPEHPVLLRVAPNDQDLPAVVNGDETRLRQIITNLLGNAGMHTPVGTRVTVTVAAEDPVAVLTVADTGPGLTPEVAERVFERFYRADTSRTRASGGTGLGLSIVAALVEAHGGTITARAGDDHGAVFEVRIPLRPADAR